MTWRTKPPACAPVLHFDPTHPASAATVALAKEQRASDFRGPGDFGKGTVRTRPRKSLSQREAEDGRSTPHMQPHWIMDQIYLLLTSFHVVIKPFAMASVPILRRIRTIKKRDRFVNTYTKATLGLFQTVAPALFRDANGGRWVFEEPVLHKVLCSLLNAACEGNPRKPKAPWNFNWDNFQVTPEAYTHIIFESLRGFKAAAYPPVMAI